MLTDYIPVGGSGEGAGVSTTRGPHLVWHRSRAQHTGDMVTVCEVIKDRYSEPDPAPPGCGYSVTVASSPQQRRGLLPAYMSLIDYNIERAGLTGNIGYSLGHITELDLSDNLISDWAAVAEILAAFPRLTFLNLARNMLRGPAPLPVPLPATRLARLVLNGNAVDWGGLSALLASLPTLTELRLTNNSLVDPPAGLVLHHSRLAELFLSCNPLAGLGRVLACLSGCHNLAQLSLSDCPVVSLVGLAPPRLARLNISGTGVADWGEVERLRNYPALTELRIMDCPVSNVLGPEQRRQELLARLPNISILNGGDQVSDTEREEAERSCLRRWTELPEQERPARWAELVSLHGQLEPLARVDLTPEIFFRVTVEYKEQEVQLTVSVRQRVRRFKDLLARVFPVPARCMRLWYLDQDLWRQAGPVECKWPMKGLYTYDLQHGDRFLVEKKHPEKCGQFSSCNAGNSPQSKRQKTKIEPRKLKLETESK